MQGREGGEGGGGGCLLLRGDGAASPTGGEATNVHKGSPFPTKMDVIFYILEKGAASAPGGKATNFHIRERLRGVNQARWKATNVHKGKSSPSKTDSI